MTLRYSGGDDGTKDLCLDRVRTEEETNAAGTLFSRDGCALIFKKLVCSEVS